ncbi:type II toxin-antitoxin system Phd/YefM family antitoxin [Jatrophihabitans fulvus]
MAQQVNVYEAKTHLSKLIDRVLAGERVVIARAGRPVVDLVVHTGTEVVVGGLRGRVRFDEREFEAADTEVAAMFDHADDIETTS